MRRRSWVLMFVLNPDLTPRQEKFARWNPYAPALFGRSGVDVPFLQAPLRMPDPTSLTADKARAGTCSWLFAQGLASLLRTEYVVLRMRRLEVEG